MAPNRNNSLSAAEYKVLVEQAPILIWRANTTTECDYFNERWLEFTGRTMEEEYGNGWAQGVHAEDMDRCLKIYLDAFAERRVFEMEYRLRRHDGEYRWIFDRGVPYYGDDGVFAGFIGSCIDINEAVLSRLAAIKVKEEEIETLKGLLPICSHCHKIRDESGRWRVLETYIEEHSKVSFSHGICQECLQKHFPDFAD